MCVTVVVFCCVSPVDHLSVRLVVKKKSTWSSFLLVQNCLQLNIKLRKTRDLFMDKLRKEAGKLQSKNMLHQPCVSRWPTTIWSLLTLKCVRVHQVSSDHTHTHSCVGTGGRSEGSVSPELYRTHTHTHTHSLTNVHLTATAQVCVWF